MAKSSKAHSIFERISLWKKSSFLLSPESLLGERFGQGEKGKRLYIIERGIAGVITSIHMREDLRKPLEQKYKILAQLGKGDFFGEIGLFTSNPRSASIVAKSAVEVICLGENERDYLETASQGYAANSII